MMVASGVENYPTLGELLPGEIGGEHVNLPVGPLCLDSRLVNRGDTFVALAGSRVQGSSYIDQAIAAGAGLVLCQESVAATAQPETAPVIFVAELKQRISAIASRWYGNPSQDLSVVGITGTNGKTTCSFWLAHVVQQLQGRAATIGTLGYGLVDSPTASTGLTTPDPIKLQQILSELKQQGASHVMMEVSSHSLDQHRADGVAFDAAVLTNISRDHLDYHGSIDAYVEAKKRLVQFNSLASAVINLDDAYAHDFIDALVPDAALVSYGLSNPQADFHLQRIQYSASGVAGELCTPLGRLPFDLPIWGQYNLSNLLAVVSCCHALGFNLNQVVEQLSSLPVVPGRMELVATDEGQLVSDIKVFIDFAHTDDALDSVLQALRAHVSTGSLHCVFGCGGDRDIGKRPLMAAVAERWADQVVITSDNPRGEDANRILDQIEAGFSSTAQWLRWEQRGEAIARTIAAANPGDVVLIAGKGHEDYQIIGSQKLPFSDVDEARQALRLRAVQHGEDRGGEDA